jgi:YacP-like NYN domain
MSRRGPVHCLVDAHNVLHQDAVLARHMHEPENARHLLEELLADKPNMHVFYDGGPNGEQRAHRRQGLQIDYSGNDEADNRIIRWLQQHSELRAVVISDDHDLCRRARALGATTAPARGFLQGFRTRLQQTELHRGPLSPAEVDDWMRIFGLNDPGAEAPEKN